MKQIIISDDIKSDVAKLLSKYKGTKKFVIVDSNTQEYCLPLIKEVLDNPKILGIKQGEKNKNIKTIQSLWHSLIKNTADRNSLVINLGGGLLCDVGGFAAATFKRGINYINIPTTLLAQVDASTGGKTGINYDHYKNEIGSFHNPIKTIISNTFLRTLDKKNILSGFAEMFKHSIIADENYYNELKNFDLENINYSSFTKLIKKSIEIKTKIVEQDFKEENIRKSLNLGHTLGHAFESFFTKMSVNILHGEAVAMGIVCEAYLSNKIINMPRAEFDDICEFIKQNFTLYKIKKNYYERIYKIIIQDKKNIDGKINTTLINNIGRTKINNFINKNDVFECLEFYRNFAN